MTKKMRYLLMSLMVLLAVAAAKPVDVEAMPRPSGLYAWTTTDMCIRSYPGIGGDIVAVVPRESELIVVSTDDNPVDGFHWAYVKYPDVEGYMAYANQAQTLTFLEFQRWDEVEGSSGLARLLRAVTLYAGPNPELSWKLASVEAGREVYIQEMTPVKYGNSICRVEVNGLVGYIPANNEVEVFYEYLGNPDSSESASIAPTTDDTGEIDKIGIVNRPMCLRSMPNKNSEILRVADTFEEVWVESLEVNASGEQWYRIISGTTEAYVASFGVNVGRTLDRDGETTTDLNLRSGPSTESQIWVTLPEGYQVWCMSEFSGATTQEKWVRVAVDFNGRKYYGFVVGWGLNLN